METTETNYYLGHKCLYGQFKKSEFRRIYFHEFYQCSRFFLSNRSFLVRNSIFDGINYSNL